MTEALDTLPTAGRSYRRTADFAVEKSVILLECGAVENGNPLFWQPEVAHELTGGDVAPPSMLSTWMRPHAWSPVETTAALPLQLHFDLKDHFGLAEAVVADYLLTLHEPVRVGDVITTDQRLTSVGEPKQTRRGLGRFWTLDVDYVNQDGVLVGVETWTLFGYNPPASDLGTPS